MEHTQTETRQKIEEFIESLISERQEILKNDTTRANEIEEELSRLNVKVQDVGSGTRWTMKNKPESYVSNCFFKAKENDTIFCGYDGSIYATLDGYAIVPIEEYFELTGESVP